MTNTHASRIFASGNAQTLYVTIPAAIATDSQFPFEPDDSVTVTIDDGALIVTLDEDGE